MLGLANLYYIDPEDREIASELLVLRRDLSKLIQACRKISCLPLGISLGEALLGCCAIGCAKEPLERETLRMRSCRLQPQQGEFWHPGALNAFLVAMIYFEPGSMRVDGAESKLGMALPHYEQVF